MLRLGRISRELVAACAAAMMICAAFAPADAKEKAAADNKTAQAGESRLTLDQMIEPVVRVRGFIAPEARTIEALGHERDGSGIVIDDNGLVLTIGYLMVEAYAAEIITNDGRKIPAEIIGYDPETGFALLRATKPLNLRAMPLGRASDLKPGERVMAASYGGRDGAVPAFIAEQREFAGPWEYLIDGAIFTTPAHSHWSGAALINRDGKLVGVGSLILHSVGGKFRGIAGNMYVPIDLLMPVLGDLLADGQVKREARPWLGMNAEEVDGQLIVRRIIPASPAAKSGLQRGDVISTIGGEKPSSLADLYRKIWARGRAGVGVPLDIERGDKVLHFDVKSMNQQNHLRLKPTF